MATESSWHIFMDVSTQFPTVCFSLLLVLCIVYWLSAIAGVADMDMLDLDGDSDGVLAGLLLKLGLNDLPLTVTLSALALCGWLQSFVMCSLLPPLPPGAVGWLAGAALLVAVSLTASASAGLLLRPLKPLFQSLNREAPTQLIGLTARVRTGSVSVEFGEVEVEDGGAGIIVRARSPLGHTFAHGERVVLLERLDDGAYRVILETEFQREIGLCN